MNRIGLECFLTKDPEVITTKNGKHFVRMAVGYRNRPASKDDQYNKPNYLIAQAYGKVADQVLAQGLKKGSRVRLEGELEINDYQTQDGHWRKMVRLQVGYFTKHAPIVASNREDSTANHDAEESVVDDVLPDELEA